MAARRRPRVSTGSRAPPSGSSSGARAPRRSPSGCGPTRLPFARPSVSDCSKRPASAVSGSVRSNGRCSSSRACRLQPARSPSRASASSSLRSRSARETSAPSPQRWPGAPRPCSHRDAADGPQAARTGARRGPREPRRRRRRRAPDAPIVPKERLLEATELSVTREGFAYDPQRGELWYAGEAAEAVLLELEARRRALEGEIEELDAAARARGRRDAGSRRTRASPRRPSGSPRRSPRPRARRALRAEPRCARRRSGRARPRARRGAP